MVSKLEYSIPKEIVKSVCLEVKETTNIRHIPYEKIEALRDMFCDFLNTTSAIDNLENKNGIIAFNFEDNDELELSEKINITTALFHLVNSSIYNPLQDSKNGIPFTTYKCSAENPDRMKAAGIKFYSPDEKLGYHNDVFHNNGNYSIPRYVSLTNLFIGYSNPGNFYYINQNIWDDFDKLFLSGEGIKFKFRPTPVVSESDLSKSEDIPPPPTWVDVPVFWKNEDGKRYVFSNGELRDNEDTTIISELKNSLLNNSKKMSISQNTNKIIVFRNDIGFHSRDIFKDQFILNGTTRLFLRAVSERSIKVP